jgi:hypothetical protein
VGSFSSSGASFRILTSGEAPLQILVLQTLGLKKQPRGNFVAVGALGFRFGSNFIRDEGARHKGMVFSQTSGRSNF